jgi:surface antigen
MNIQSFSTKKDSLVKARKVRVRRIKKNFAKYGLLGFNVCLILVVSGFLLYGRQLSTSSDADLSERQAEEVVVLDQISSADIAVNIAEAARLPEVTQVRNQADSRNALVAIAISDDVVVTKPQIVTDVTSGSQSRKDISQYTSVAGDTIASLAEKFNVSSDSIRWSNGLTGDTVTAGRQMVIPPKNRNGIVYKVTATDTIEKIAEKYKSSAEKLIVFNDLELTNQLPVDQYIFIPDGEKPPEPVQYRNTTPTTYATGAYTARFGGNGYASGYCTWWAADRRAQIGRPIPSNLGNANTWLRIAQSIGYETGADPRVGAVVWFEKPATWAGHVGIVENVFADGSFELSEMNGRAGWGRVSSYVVPPSELGDYQFIY